MATAARTDISVAPEGMRYCPICQRLRDVSEFHYLDSERKRPMSDCKECHATLPAHLSNKGRTRHKREEIAKALITLDRDQSELPTLSRMMGGFIYEFGGMKGFIVQVMQDVHDARVAGKHKLVLDIEKALIGFIARANQTEGNISALQNMSDDDIDGFIFDVVAKRIKDCGADAVTDIIPTGYKLVLCEEGEDHGTDHDAAG